MSSAGLSIADLKSLIQRDILACEHIQIRIDELRDVILAGKTIADANALDSMETEGRKMLRDLLSRIDAIEGQATDLTATDREMLQALNARQVVCDKQVMQLAELRDLHRQARGLEFEVLEDELEPEEEEEEEEGEGEQVDGEDQEEEFKESWPLCYRIMDVDPKTEKYYYDDVCKKAYRSLSLKHDPKRLPNDPDAPARWTAINKAYETITDREKRQYYDLHGKVPAALEDFDLSTLSIGDERQGSARQNAGSVVQEREMEEIHRVGGDDVET